MPEPPHRHCEIIMSSSAFLGGAEFARNGICKERGWKLQGKENSRKGCKMRIHVNLQGNQQLEFARNAYAYTI